MIVEALDLSLEEQARLIYELAAASFPNGAPWSVEQLREDLDLAYSHYLFWQTANQVVAFLHYHQIEQEVEILQLAVLPAYRRQGIAEKLCQYLFTTAELTNIEQIFLEVRDSNTAARKCYQKIGFKELYCRKNYYHAPVENAWVMVKRCSRKDSL